MKSPLRLSGIGLRPPHIESLLTELPPVAWVEIHSENFFSNPDFCDSLLKIREHYPVSLHGVCMSLGSSDDLDWNHAKQLKNLINFINPCLISEHLSWSRFDNNYYHDLLPLPYNHECLTHLTSRISQVQDYLGRQILIENISAYHCFAESTYSEAEFLQALANASGCGILLDVNNIYVNCKNLKTNPLEYIQKISPHHVHEFHLAGFTQSTIEDVEILIDTHNNPVAEEVWQLFRDVVRQFGRKPCLIEWDHDLPTLETLCDEAFKAEQLLRAI